MRIESVQHAPPRQHGSLPPAGAAALAGTWQRAIDNASFPYCIRVPLSTQGVRELTLLYSEYHVQRPTATRHY